MRKGRKIFLVSLAAFGLFVAVNVFGATYGKVFQAHTEDFNVYDSEGPYKVDSTGKFDITVKWTAKKKGAFASNKVSPKLQVYQKSGGTEILKSRIKKDAPFEDEFSVSFTFTQSMLDRSEKVYFRVCEDYTGATQDVGEFGVYTTTGKKHKIDYKIIVKWTPKN
ncbi:hypothetical protein ACFLT9_01355 [Acidobacteriota bacterium]